MYPHLNSLFDDATRKAVLACPRTNKAQPLARLLGYGQTQMQEGDPSGLGYTVAKTEQAVRWLQRRPQFSSWLRDAALKAADCSDYENASGALAEIRALGSMIGAGMPVEPVSRKAGLPTPDFRMPHAGEVFNFEIACKQMNRSEAAKMANADAAPWVATNLPGIKYQAVKISPHGWRDGETQLENATQKLAQAKAKSKQAVDGERNILWLDLEDEDMWTLTAGHANPIATFHARFYGGAVWNSFYGQKGMPLLEHHHMFENLHTAAESTQSMRFDGRFRSPDNKFDAAFVSFPEQLVAFDNPWRTPAFPALAPIATRMAGYRHERSWVDWPRAGSLIARVENAVSDIHEIAKVSRGASYPDPSRITGIQEVPEWQNP